MKKYFLVINEDINSGLLQSQLINPIVTELNNVTIINICKPNKKYSHDDVKIINIPIAIPYKIYLFNNLSFLIPFFAFIYSLILTFFVKSNSIIIARSYFPSYVLYFLSKIKKIKFIFDSRSLFIDENITAKRIRKNSITYRRWKNIEEKLIKHSDKTIAVSLKQKEYYRKINSKANILLIPCYITKNKIIDELERKKIRELNYIKEDDIVVGYFGSLDNGWNNKTMYNNFFNECIINGYKIVIISQNYLELKNDVRFIKDNIILINTTSLSFLELKKMVQIFDYGVILMKKTLDWETRLSVKFVDYLNSGVNVIVGKHVGEAVRYANSYFINRTIIYNDKLIKLNKLNKLSVDNNVYKLFGPHNIKKIF